MEQKPSVGRIVYYRIAANDVEAISKLGGNAQAEGDMVPAMIVRLWDESTGCSNLTLFLDGPATLRKTSVVRGDQPGQWSWPPRV
jgi:hypothetical protein